MSFVIEHAMPRYICGYYYTPPFIYYETLCPNDQSVTTQRNETYKRRPTQEPGCFG